MDALGHLTAKEFFMVIRHNRLAKEPMRVVDQMGVILQLLVLQT